VAAREKERDIMIKTLNQIPREGGEKAKNPAIRHESVLQWQREKEKK